MAFWAKEIKYTDLGNLLFKTPAAAGKRLFDDPEHLVNVARAMGGPHIADANLGLSVRCIRSMTMENEKEEFPRKQELFTRELLHHAIAGVIEEKAMPENHWLVAQIYRKIDRLLPTPQEENIPASLPAVLPNVAGPEMSAREITGRIRRGLEIQDGGNPGSHLTGNDLRERRPNNGVQSREGKIIELSKLNAA